MSRVVDTNGTEWKRTFYVYVSEGWLGDDLKKCCGSMTQAETEAKKYVHLGRVKIKEQLERVAKTYEQKEVCA